MTMDCPEVYVGDLITWQGVRGLVDREWSAYEPDGRHKGWKYVLLEDGSKWWMPPDLLLARRIRAEFLGMPNEDNRPLPGSPLTLWQEIPHEYDEYLSWQMNMGCMYCGLDEEADVHPQREA